jgi:hypothetical protein
VQGKKPSSQQATQEGISPFEAKEGMIAIPAGQNEATKNPSRIWKG